MKILLSVLNLDLIERTLAEARKSKDLLGAFTLHEILLYRLADSSLF